jgi:DNA-binding transcriptional ArsR family regulator
MSRRAPPGKRNPPVDIGGAARAVQLDALIHERVRLGILSALAASDRLSFTELRDALGVTDGNLGVHARKLEEAGYVECEKRFAQRKPRTEYRLTTKGRNAFASYLFRLESVIQSARNG